MSKDTVTPSPGSVNEPFPIFKLAHHYLLYDIDTVSHVRRNHNICGVLVGSLPQSPQQNIFLGLPLELMPEDARLLVEKNVAFIVDDTAVHKRTFLAGGLSPQERKAYQAALRRQGIAAAKDVDRKREEDKKAALQKKKDAGNWNDIPEDMLRTSSEQQLQDMGREKRAGPPSSEGPVEEEEAIFASLPPKSSQPLENGNVHAGLDPEPFLMTPTTSEPLINASPPVSKSSTLIRALPETPPSYPLFAYMHSRKYFLTPGLRFGCQYMAYPGDPLRFHSHFLCNGMEWDEEFDLLDLVGGGRLGTGVKKGFLIGGQQEGDHDASEQDRVRAFCIEWAGM